jgi:hypothetical protein
MYGSLNKHNTEGAIKNGQSRETGNTITKTQHNMCLTPL